MEGFEGIVGIGAGGKKVSGVVQHPKTAGLNKVKPDTNKPKKEQAQVAPISLGIFGSGMQKKWLKLIIVTHFVFFRGLGTGLAFLHSFVTFSREPHGILPCSSWFRVRFIELYHKFRIRFKDVILLLFNHRDDFFACWNVFLGLQQRLQSLNRLNYQM